MANNKIKRVNYREFEIIVNGENRDYTWEVYRNSICYSESYSESTTEDKAIDEAKGWVDEYYTNNTD